MPCGRGKYVHLSPAALADPEVAERTFKQIDELSKPKPKTSEVRKMPGSEDGQQVSPPCRVPVWAGVRGPS